MTVPPPSPRTARSVRHPEKQNKPDNPAPPKPAWIRARAPVGPEVEATNAVMKTLSLHTVCEEAACPNIGDCWKRRHATFLILGAICTRACAFCNVATGKPLPLDPHEPERLAEAVHRMGLRHVVITSVDRDDLPDGGAEHFVRVIEAVRRDSPETTIEILTPDFMRKPGAVARIVEVKPDVFSHNLETVPRLYPTIRPGARYFTSLRLLAEVKERNSALFTKSGLMLGLGETLEEVAQVMDDLRAAGVEFLTLGQYLQPTPKHAHVDRFVTPDEFDHLATLARAKGFLMVASSPLTRSSFHADEDFAKLKAARG